MTVAGGSRLIRKASARFGPTLTAAAARRRRRGALYQELLKPEGPIVFAGEHLSYQPTWQEGAALSAHEALKLVEAMAKAKAA